MKKFLFLVITILAIGLLFNSCQKEQNKILLDKSEPVSKSVNSGPGAESHISGLPDIFIDANRLKSSLVIKNKVFRPGDCAVFEGCVNGSGKRKLLRFDVATPNRGVADLHIGSPVDNPLFELSPCHGHYHLSDYANYELLNSNGVVVTGHKQAFCLKDVSRYDRNAGPSKYTCSDQGISVGWQDVYGSYLDCQWLDITGIPAGEYSLRVSINSNIQKRIFEESDYDNNVVTVPVKIK